jgi:aminoglycoside phosphotransferase (APT) family kinase protein
MNNYQLIFVKLLEAELNRVVVPAASTDMSRRIAALSAAQLQRIVVDETAVPSLRAEAVTAYRVLLPALRGAVDVVAIARLSQALDEAGQDWAALEALFIEIAAALSARNDDASCKLIAQLVTIDSRVRNGKEAACAEAGRTPAADQKENKSAMESKTLSASDQPTEPGGLSKNQHAKLLAFLKQRFPDENSLQVVDVKPLTGGFSKQTLYVNLAGNKQLPDQLVMRRDALYVTAGGTVSTEYPIIQKMYDAGVRVPQPFAVDDTGDVLGTPFILVSRVVGRTIGNFPVVAEPSREVAMNLARQLAKLHSVSIDGMEHLLHGGNMSVPDRLLGEIEMHEAMYKTVINNRAFIVQPAIDWLKRNIALAGGPRCVSHRDVGVHNFMVHEKDVSAFLDWETAVAGTPAEDVAYTYYQVVQMTEWKDYLAAYEAASGIRFDKRSLDFYMLWGSVRVAVGMSKMVDPVFSGERVNLPEYYLWDYFGQTLLQRVANKFAEVLA